MKQLHMRFPQGRTKALTLSYDDGCMEDQRLAAIFARHGLKCTFNLNSGLFSPPGTVYTATQRLTLEDAKNLYADPLFEVACHGLDHPHLEQMPAAISYGQILYDRMALEQHFGCRITGMAYPYGTYNDEVVRLCRSAGIRYARTVHPTHRFDLPADWMTLHPTCHHADPALPELTERFLSTQYTASPQMFYVWGHSFEFGREDNWPLIEGFTERVAGREDIWYATNSEIESYCRDFGRLEFAADGSFVRNPNARTVWFACHDGGEPHPLAPGETARLEAGEHAQKEAAK